MGCTRPGEALPVITESTKDVKAQEYWNTTLLAFKRAASWLVFWYLLVYNH